MATIVKDDAAGLIVGFLTFQFTIGILANLYSQIPEHNPAQVFHQLNFIIVHVANAFLLLFLSSRHFYRVTKDMRPKREPLTGLVSIILSVIFGFLFVLTQNEIFSFLMAMGFISAFTSYFRLALTGDTMPRQQQLNTKKIK